MKVNYKTFWIIICQYSIAIGFVYNCSYLILSNFINLMPVTQEYSEFILWGFTVCSGGQILKKHFIKEKIDNNQE